MPSSTDSYAINLHNIDSSPDNSIESPNGKDNFRDDLLKKLRELTIYIEPLQELCDSLQIKKIQLEQLGNTIELADKLTNDLMTPLELTEYTHSCHLCSFIENRQFDNEYQDKLLALDERLGRAEVLKDEGYTCASEVHTSLRRLAKTVSNIVCFIFRLAKRFLVTSLRTLLSS